MTGEPSQTPLPEPSPQTGEPPWLAQIREAERATTEALDAGHPELTKALQVFKASLPSQASEKLTPGQIELLEECRKVEAERQAKEKTPAPLAKP